MNIYVSKDGKQYGPYTVKQLREYVRQGDFTTDDLACHWLPIAEIPGFAAPTPTASTLPPLPTEQKAEALPQEEEEFNRLLKRWPLVAIKEMTLQEYVGIKNPDTFCYFVGTVRWGGSIRGGSAIKFGIYERGDPNKKPKVYRNDDKYSWWPKYGNDRNTAFKKIQNEVIETIELSGKGEFHLIDDIPLADLIKWKIAFLYSNDGLIPIYRREWLLAIAGHFGLPATRNTKVSDIQSIMMSNKPAHRNVGQYAGDLEGIAVSRVGDHRKRYHSLK